MAAETVFCFSAFPVHVEDAAQHCQRLLPSWRTDGLVACKYLYPYSACAPITQQD